MSRYVGIWDGGDGYALATPDVEPGSFVVLAVDDGTCTLRALETDGAGDLILEIGPRGGVRRVRR
jgi:hypothetical protein